MRKFTCASVLVAWAFLAPTTAAQAQLNAPNTNHSMLAQAGNSSISVPPFVTRGFPNYPDGTPCIGTPKDPTSWPDKLRNPCDGIPLQPELIPGPFPPAPPAVNVTAPGGQTVPPAAAPQPGRVPAPAASPELAPETSAPAPVPSGPAIFIAPPARPGSKPVPTIKQRDDGSLYIEYPEGYRQQPIKHGTPDIGRTPVVPHSN